MWNKILYDPLFNLLVVLYNFLGHNMGIAIIALTLVVRFILWPLTQKSLVAQKKMNLIKPHLEKIKKDHGHDQRKMSEATMALYKEHGINPLTSCLPLLIQFPIFIALYRVFYNIASLTTYNFYAFVHRPETINTQFLWFNLAKPDPYYILPILVGVTFFWQTKISSPKQSVTPAPAGKGMMEDFQQTFQKQMLYIFPVMFTLITLKLTTALSLYWVVTTLFGIGQQYLVMRDGKTTIPKLASSSSAAAGSHKGKSGKTNITVRKRR